MGYWGKIAKRAAREAAEDVRLRAVPVVVSFVAQAIIGAVLFIAAGAAGANIPLRLLSAAAPFLTFPILFGYRLITVPAVMAGEAHQEAAALAAEYKAAEAGLAEKVAALSAEVENLKKPKPAARNPDAIYQGGYEVGRVVVAVLDLTHSAARFAMIRTNGECDLNREFEYRDLVLILRHADSIGHASTMGEVSQMANNAVCQVVRRL